MARKRAASRQVRPAAGDHPPPAPQPRPPGAVHQPPVPEGVEQQAQKLIHEAGSPDRAKSAVDVAAEREALPDFREDHLALRFGFPARRELLAASTPVTTPGGAFWWATPVGEGRWIVWNREDMSAETTFESLDAVRRHLLAATV